MAEYEERMELSSFWGWVALTLVSFSLIGYGMIAMFLVKDPPQRVWDYGSAIGPPGSTIYTTIPVKKTNKTPSQIGLIPVIPQCPDTISNANTFNRKIINK